MSHKIITTSLLTSFIAAAALSATPLSAAENLFGLNFQPVTGATPFFDANGGTSIDTTDVTGASYHVTGQTPFLNEIVTDPTTNFTYYHMVLGDPSQGFAQEVYVRSSATYGLFQGGPATASSGTCCPGGNSSDPLAVRHTILYQSGDGSANPNQVIVRQVMSDPTISTEFLKASFNNKPKITQDVTDTGMAEHVVLDMSNSDYSTANVPGTFVNTLSLQDGGQPFAAGSFDVAAGAQHSTVTAGEYTYTPASGNNAAGINGTYSYAGGGSANNGWVGSCPSCGADSDIYWPDFWDPSQANPWADPTYRP